MPFLATPSSTYLKLRGLWKLRITAIPFTSPLLIRDCSLVCLVRRSTHPRTIGMNRTYCHEGIDSRYFGRNRIYCNFKLSVHCLICNYITSNATAYILLKRRISLICLSPVKVCMYEPWYLYLRPSSPIKVFFVLWCTRECRDGNEIGNLHSYLNSNVNPTQRQNISPTKCNAGTQTLAWKLVEYKQCIDALPHVFFAS
jgi:hypothetical protein